MDWYSFLAVLVLTFCAAAPIAAAPVLVADVDYRADTQSAFDPLRALDIYYPSERKLARRIVFFIHGGGWAIGDKSNQATLAKAQLFTDLGYVFVSTNYRLSPRPGQEAGTERIRHPVHINDVADALAFLVTNASSLDLDVKGIGLVGHSSGAHLAALLASDQALLKRRHIDPAIIKGLVVLDTLALDVDTIMKTKLPPRARSIYENAFGSAEENQNGELWRSASPIVFADAADPPVLVITQSRVTNRVEQALRFIRALEQPSTTSLFTVTRSHRQINHDLGGAEDPAGITTRVVEFFDQVFASENAADLASGG